MSRGFDRDGLASSFCSYSTSGVLGLSHPHLPDLHIRLETPFGRHFIHTEISSLLSRLADQFPIFDVQDLRSEGGLMPIHDVSVVAKRGDIAAAHKTLPLCSLNLLLCFDFSCFLERRAVFGTCFFWFLISLECFQLARGASLLWSIDSHPERAGTLLQAF